MSLRHSAFYTPYLLTMGAGLLKQQGLKHHYTVATPNNTVENCINNGSADVSQYAVAASFGLLESGTKSNLIHFAQINQKDGFFIVARHPQAPFKWQDLVGKKVLVDHLFQPLATLSYVLHQHGLSLNDVDVIDAGNVEQMEQHFKDGHGDYMHTQGPTAQKLAVGLSAQIQTTVGEALDDIAFSSLCCHKNEVNTPKIQAFLVAYKQAIQMAVNLPATQLANLVGQFFKQDDTFLLIETIHYYQQMGCWSKNHRISQSSFDNLQEVFLFNKLIKQKFDYKQLIVDI